MGSAECTGSSGEGSLGLQPRGTAPLEVASPSKKLPLSTEVVAHLFDEHGRELLLFLTGVLRDAHLAADVAQITFSRLIEQGGETAEETRKAWIFRVAFNEALDWRRKQARRERLLPEAAQSRSYFASEPIVEILKTETVNEVREAIEKLRRLSARCSAAECMRNRHLPRSPKA